MFKRLIVVLVLLAVVLTACATPTAAPTTAPAKAFRIAVVMPSATTDMAFSQSMWNALTAIQKEMGGESALEIKFSE
ncbi:hypothetical protein EG834_06655, partial [bacterium]|nr:hypothetical protein [bacterium]